MPPTGVETVARTDRDLSMKFVGIGLVLLMAAIVLAPSLHMNLLGAGAGGGVSLSVCHRVVAHHRRDRFLL